MEKPLVPLPPQISIAASELMSKYWDDSGRPLFLNRAVVIVDILKSSNDSESFRALYKEVLGEIVPVSEQANEMHLAWQCYCHGALKMKIAVVANTVN